MLAEVLHRLIDAVGDRLAPDALAELHALADQAAAGVAGDAEKAVAAALTAPAKPPAGSSSGAAGA